MRSNTAFSLWNKVAQAHRSDDDTGRGVLVDFLFPRLTRGFFIRLAAIIVLAIIFFTFFLMPCVIDGESMMPTYDRHGFTFCKKWSYWFKDVQRSDVVIVSYTGRTYLLKRVVALAGDTVEFRKGKLFVNGKMANEPYVRYVSNWELPPRKVEKGNCYVVGDNRSQPIKYHIFGQVPLSRIAGQPVFDAGSAPAPAKETAAANIRQEDKSTIVTNIKRQTMKQRYIDLMEKVLSAYSNEHIDRYYEQVKTEGLKEHGFARLASNIGILIAHGRRQDLRERFVKLMDLCCERMPDAKFAGNEFTIKEVLFCLMLLQEKSTFPQSQIDKWKNTFRTLDMAKCYHRFAVKADDEVNNWALFCMVSEWMRRYNNLNTDMDFIELQAVNQTRHFDKNGMFIDPGAPAVYDLVPRGLYAVLMHFGYNGKLADVINTNLQKSGEASAKMQSVTGEIPFGGRSHQFLHNESHQAIIMEFEAARYAKLGDRAKAKQFKNAVKLALDNIELHLAEKPIHHIKNRFPLESRFGCENYAYFDKYMITCASFLYVAHLLCDESVEPDANPTLPATAWATTDTFHWLFLRTPEYAVQIDTNANLKYDCSGAGRVHRRNAPSEICLSVPCTAKPSFVVDIKKTVNLSLAPGVVDNNKITYATGKKAAYTIKSYSHTENSAQAQLECKFTNGRTLTADYLLTNDGLTIKIKGKGELAHLIPAFEFNGRDRSDIRLNGNILEVRYKNWICRYTASAQIADTGKRAANRNGHYRAFSVKAKDELTMKVEVVRE